MAKFGRTHPRAVVPLLDVARASGRRDTQVGALGRAHTLLEELGVVVPETWVVVADLFRHVVSSELPAGHDPGSLLRLAQRPLGAERAARARDELLEVVLDSDIEREIDAAYRALTEAAPWGLAVRASALVTDEGVARAAGLARTELAVMSRDDLGRAIRRTWALAASASALGYLRGRKYRNLSMAVLIQPVVRAHATAAFLTDARPVRKDEASDISRIVVAVPGLALGGFDLARAQAIHFDADGRIRDSRPSKVEQCFVVKQGAIRSMEARGTEPVSRPRVRELVEIGKRVESLGALELRCVVPEEGDIAVVDARFLHHGGNPGTGSAQTVWSRAWSADVPGEPLTPLSRRLLTRPTIERMQRVLGHRAPRAARLASTVADVDGRLYVNLSLLLETTAGEGEFVDRRSQVELLGAQWAPEIEDGPSPRASLARAVLRLAHIATEQRVLGDAVGRFERDAEQQRRWLAEMDLAILPDDALTTTLGEVRAFLESAHRLHADTTAAVVGCHALLASVLASVDVARASFLAHVVTAGADLVTARPALAWSHVAALAALDVAGRGFLESGRVDRGLSALPEGPCRRALLQFLEAFGDRGLVEAELGSPRWSEDPRPVLRMLAAALRGRPVDAEVARDRARASADRELSVLEKRLSFFEFRFVRDVASRQRELLGLRERCRMRIAHGLKMMRTVALDIDRRIRRLDPALEPESALFLTLEELGSALKKSRDDLAPVARARRADFAAHRRAGDPAPVFRGVPPVQYPFHEGRQLRGIPASSGSGTGRAVRLGSRLEGIDRFSPGDVLVVRSLDPGLMPLLLLASAAVSELGTPFSSSVLVAKDFAVPVVTGLANAWLDILDGDVVRVDGDSGAVEHVSP